MCIHRMWEHWARGSFHGENVSVHEAVWECVEVFGLIVALGGLTLTPTVSCLPKTREPAHTEQCEGLTVVSVSTHNPLSPE